MKLMNNTMRLRPLDFSILQNLSTGRNVAANIYIELDSAQPYVSERLGELNDHGLVDKVGPNENSGLYEITDSGRRALEHQALYKEDQERFEDIVENDVPVDDT